MNLLLTAAGKPNLSSGVILDSSAILAMMLGEPGGESLVPMIKGSGMCTVNMSEVVAKLCEQGENVEFAREQITSLSIFFFDFDQELAILAGMLRPYSKHLGLSLGDRACLALGMREKAVVVTADRAWQELELDLEIELIR